MQAWCGKRLASNCCEWEGDQKSTAALNAEFAELELYFCRNNNNNHLLSRLTYYYSQVS
jgi:hypothetical protein